jgi:tetratricopeptide (TPR) repeat protein
LDVIMALEVLLNLIKERFDTTNRKIIAESLQHDPLIWQFVQDLETSLPYFEAATTRDSFTPGAMIQWLIESQYGWDIRTPMTAEAPLPEDLAEAATRAFESTLSAGLPPADLLSAGLLTVALLKIQAVEGQWQGIAEKLLIKQGTRGVEKNVQIWQTPVAGLFSLLPDFETFIDEFLQAESPATRQTGFDLFVHNLLSNPLRQAEKLDDLYNHLSGAGIDSQLQVLKALETANQHQLGQLLASNLMQVRTTTEAIAKIYSELEAFQTPSDRVDPLQKSVRVSLAEDLNKLGALLHFAGNENKSSEAYRSAGDILSFINLQSQFQAVAGKNSPDAKATWMSIIQSVPSSKLAQLHYSHYLIEQGDAKGAEEQLSQLPDSAQKAYLTTLIAKASAKGITDQISLNLAQTKSAPNTPDFFVHDFALDCDDAILETAVKNDAVKLATSKWTPQLSNRKQVRLMRDWLWKSGQFTQAIDLTSYLELVEPESNDHRKALAKLYGQAKQWSKAFTAIQDIVKSEVSPSVDDLVLFAESALNTKRTDLAISICQNVLKETPTQSKALILLGEGFWQKGDTVKAIQHMEKVVETIPEESDTWLALAQIWRENDQTDKTLDVLQKGVVAIPDSPELLRELGKLMLEKQSPADAITYLKKAHELDKHNAEGQFHLARANYKLGRYEDAWALLESHMAEYEANASVAKLLGHVLLAMGESAKAKPILIFSAENFNEDRDTVLSAAKVVIGEAEAAEEVNSLELTNMRSILSTYLSNQGADSQVNLNLADVDRLLGNNQEAFDAYLNVSKQIHPAKSRSSWQLQYGIGKTALAMNKIEMAVATLQEAANQQPENIMIRHALAEAYQASNLPAKANDTALLALKLAPQDLTNIQWYAGFQMDAEQPAVAAKALKEALLIQPNEPSLKLWLVKAQLTLGEIDAAEANLLDVINGAAASTVELQSAAYLSIRLNNFNLAIKALEKAIENADSFSPQMVMDLTAAYTSQNQRREALATLDLDADITYQYPELAVLKADILDYLGQYEPALGTLMSIQNLIEESFATQPERVLEYAKSPLLYPIDFSLAGFYYRLGQFNRALGNPNEALQNFETALAKAPENLKIRLAYAETYTMVMAFESAYELAAEIEIERQDQDSLDFSCLKAELAAYRSTPDAILQSENPLSTGLVTYPRLLAIQSRIAAAMGEADVARTYLDEAHKAYFENANPATTVNVATTSRQLMTLTGMAEAALDLGDLALAAKLFKQAQAIFPDQPLVNWRNAVCLAQAAEEQRKATILSITDHAPGKDFLSPAAQAQFNVLIEKVKEHLSPEDWLCLKARTTAAFEGEWQLTMNIDPCLADPESAATIVMTSDDDAIIRQVLETYPGNPRILQAYGLNALHYHKADAIPMVEAALQADPMNAANHALLAYLNQESPEIALSAIETALQIWPSESAWHAFAAELEMRSGKPTDASSHITQALDADPNNADFWLQSAEIRLVSNDLTDAKADLEKSVSIKTQNAGTWLKLAEVNRRMGDVSAAIRNVQNAQQLEPNNKSLAIKEAQLLLDKKDYETAIEKTDRILESNPEDEEAHLIKAQSYSKQGKFGQALLVLSKYLDKNPQNVRVQLETLKVKKAYEGTETALPDLVKLAEENAEDPAVLTELTDWLIQTNRLEKAEKTAQTILRIMPEQASVHLMLGRLQRKTGQLDQAIAHLSDAIVHDPTLIEAYIELGKTYQDRRNIEDAIDVYRKATEIDPSDPKPYFHTGMALKECKDYAGAEAMLKQAKALAPEDPEIIRQLGVITAMNLINHLRETS